jgi:indolepyruvate decarboxylase
MQLAEAVLRGLKAYGAGEVFGIPGDFALPFFKVAEESGILPLHTLSHEPAVGFAADAAARFRSGLGVAAVTYGAGAFNLVNSVAGAYAEKSPVVVISGAPGRRESGSGLLLHHQGRTLETQYRVYAEITCAQARLDDPATAAGEVARVLRAALDQARRSISKSRATWWARRSGRCRSWTRRRRTRRPWRPAPRRCWRAWRAPSARC